MRRVQEQRLRWSPTRWGIQFFLIVAIHLTALCQAARAQRRDLWPLVQFGRAWQGSPTDNEEGWVAGIGLPVDVTRVLGVSASLELARTHITSGISICYVIDEDHNCLKRPDSESVLTPILSLYLIAPNGRLRPYVHTGGGVGHSLADSNPGERRHFFVPQGGIGLLFHTTMGTWTVHAHWRRLDRWPGLDAGHQVALSLGFRPGG